MKKVLVIDDEEPVRSIVRFFLRKRGYRTVDAQSGDEGILIAIAELPDLVLTDVKMIGTDGLDVLKKLKSQPETACSPVFLMSGFPEKSFLRSMDEGADDYLAKPFDDGALIAAVRARLKRRRMKSAETETPE